ncbi:hypothetical protein GCM10027275_00390 [Rhabdobacter roseus]|uniref:Uncharacterized protein n=1 Tax=Rhabdobacter roseus TaxID=1655419 RepID=A0A840TL35_9BACT|nr:hypothetical protein [Rhabdobacter roseus]MBB5281923.1 hypothetical protein [Rhabdobacter roseus]
MVGESSGLARSSREGAFWTHNDSGGLPELYELDSRGTLLRTLPVPNAQNVDWEDLAQSPDGRLYIGDMGNNANQRRSLTIYTYSPEQQATEAVMTYRYADQTQFPPPPDQQHFDCEALFYFQQNLYLFTKTRSKSNPLVKTYTLPARPGEYALLPTDSLYLKAQVTGADISPDGSTFALLTYGKILLFEIQDQAINFKKPLGCIRFFKKQTEGIVFLNNKDLLVTNEQGQFFKLVRR